MIFITKKSITDEIKKAKDCRDLSTQKELSDSYNINVRRALAKNPYLNSSIADKLLFDPSINVSYRVSKNSNCTKKREFPIEFLNHKCITCEVDELVLDCENCHQ